jgi:pyridoxal phosphate enzyme (YggS family)
MSDLSYIGENYLALKDEIERISHRVGTQTPTLVCVTKSGSDEELVALVRAGAHEIGENRPQELIRRGALLGEQGLFPRLHEIGHLQTNKAGKVLKVAHLIHSVGSLSLARELSRVGAQSGTSAKILLELNSGREESKSGVLPEEAFAFFESVRALPNLSILGWMTMGPNVEGEEIRPYFRQTKAIFDTVATRYGYDTETPILSMGMSDSFGVAIEEGSTLVRVGRRLFLK